MKKSKNILWKVLAVGNLINATFWCFKGDVCFEIFSLFALYLCIRTLEKSEEQS